MDWTLEELARGALDFANVGAPVDPEVVAIAHGLKIRDGGPGCQGLLVDDTIYVDETIRPERRAFAIGHEFGHWLRLRVGCASWRREWPANYLASAMLLPYDDFNRDVRQHGWDLLALQARHRYASAEAIARRFVALREARAFVFDWPLAGQQEAGWYAVPHGLRPSTAERLAADEALASGAPVSTDTAVMAWPVIQHDWARVITLTSL